MLDAIYDAHPRMVSPMAATGYGYVRGFSHAALINTLTPTLQRRRPLAGVRSAAAMPAIERSSGRRAASSPARWRRSNSTWIAFIGSTYGFRRSIVRCTIGWRSSSRSTPDAWRTPDDRKLVLTFDGREHRVAQLDIRNELEVTARDLEARFRERHLEVVDDGAEERQLLVQAV